MQILSRKFTIALLATFFYSFILAIVNYKQAVEESLTFSTLLMTFVVLSAPMFLIIGIIASLIIEKFVSSKVNRFICYFVIGAILIIPYCLYYFKGSSVPAFMGIGAVGGAFFFWIHYVFTTYVFKNEKLEV